MTHTQTDPTTVPHTRVAGYLPLYAIQGWTRGVGWEHVGYVTADDLPFEVADMHMVDRTTVSVRLTENGHPVFEI